MTFKCRLKLIFAENDINNHGDFAKKIGISETTLSKLINNKGLPKFEVAYKIAKELNKPIEEIWVLKKES